MSRPASSPPVIGSGPTVTATYSHYMRWIPMARGVTVTPAF
jgi:hypothetical protein